MVFLFPNSEFFITASIKVNLLASPIQNYVNAYAVRALKGFYKRTLDWAPNKGSILDGVMT